MLVKFSNPTGLLLIIDDVLKGNYFTQLRIVLSINCNDSAYFCEILFPWYYTSYPAIDFFESVYLILLNPSTAYFLDLLISIFFNSITPV